MGEYMRKLFSDRKGKRAHEPISIATSEHEQVSDSLQESEKYRGLVESSGFGIATTDLKGRFTFVNEALCKMIGYPKKELIGKYFVDFLHPEDKQAILKVFLNAWKYPTRKPSLEFKVVHKRGHVIHMRSTPTLWRCNGKIVGFSAIIADITEHKKAEWMILENQRKFERLFRSNPEAAVYCDPDFHILDINPRFSELFGYSLDEIKGKQLGKIIVPEDKKEESEFLGRKSKEEHVYHDTVRMRKDGSLVPVSISVSPIIVENQLVGYIGLYKDITDKKHAEESLRESEENYRNLFENARDVIITFDSRGNITSINKTVEEYGFKRDEMIGKNMLKFVSKKYWPKLLGQLADLIRGKKVEGEIEVLTPAGKRIAEYRSNPIVKNGKVVGLQTIMRDSTERVRIEDSLRESEEKYRTLVENTKDSIVIIDLKGNVLFGNKATEELTGYTLEDGVGMNVRQVTPLKQWPKSLEMLLKAKQGKRVPYFESTIKRKDGTHIPVESGGQAIFRNGKVVGVQIITRDISERREMEDKLRQYSEHLEELVQKRTEELSESEKRYSTLVEEASDGVVIIQDEKVVFANKRSSEIFGYPKDELLGLHYDKLVAEKYQRLTKERYHQRLQGKKTPSTYEVEIVNKDGELIQIEISATAISYQSRPADLILIRDIRERKLMEEQRLKLEKLATIGEVATMVAHDLRNPLTSIRNASFYLRNTCPHKTDPHYKSRREMLEIIEQGTLFADNIISDLLDFAAIRPLQKSKQNINSLIDASLTRTHVPQNIIIKRGYAKKVTAAVDEKQLDRVFLNLTKNAVQAMPKGGTLAITTNKTESHVEIVFSDTGSGMPEESMKKIFTPLFTTKAKGIGMGLAICKKIVEQHGGTIGAKSKAGQGTAFTIRLPKKEETNVL